jgi:predicted nuclease of predicted toxin-antitoxin system
MKFLTDQDVYALTTRYLRDLGHDVVTAAELGLAQAPDELLLKRAGDEQRIFVSRDRDIGGLVFLRGISTGVFYLRIKPASLSAVHAELAHILDTYSAQILRNSFIVVMPDGHRIRNISRINKDK